jgi:deoxyribodipyrimidine photo-lyase
VSAERCLDRFLDERLARYADDRNAVDQEVTSGLSPFLHFGHISSHDVFWRLMQREGWLGDLSRRPSGAREGWWGVSRPAESFLDQLVTWRELGFNICVPPRLRSLQSLPAWARTRWRATPAIDDECTPAVFERGGYAIRCGTRLRVNSSSRADLTICGCCGARDLSGRAPQDALAIELNNKYARWPRSQLMRGICWTLGDDRPWGREPIFGPSAT